MAAPAPRACRTRRAPAALAVLAASALLLAAPAAAHGAPAVLEQDTRLLEDWTDDCGGDGGAATGACRGSIDLIALDVRETHDPQEGGLLTFRFTLDKGQPGAHSLRLSLKGDAQRTLRLETADDATFTSPDFGRVGKAVPLGDGTRFALEATVAAKDLAGSAGKLSGFKVESLAGGQPGDIMPGGCTNAVGPCVDTGQSSGSYTKPSYSLRGAGYYTRLKVPAPVEVDGATFVEVEVKNELRTTAQTVVLSREATGVTARFHDEANQEKETLELSLEGGASATVHLVLRGASPGSRVTVHADTDLGGHTDASFGAFPKGGTAATPTGTPPTPSPTAGADDGKGSPAPQALALLVALAGLAAAARRRA